MTSIGETLHRERVRRNLSLEHISRQTKISVRLLEAIESEQFEKLPGGVFTKSFVRQYARALGVEEDDVVDELQKVTQPPVPESVGKETAPAPPIRLERMPGFYRPSWRHQSESWLPALATMVGVMLVCSLVYMWWQRPRHQSLPAEKPPARQAASLPANAAPASTAAVNSPAAPAVTGQEAAPVPAGIPGSESKPAEPAPLGTPAGAIQLAMSAQEPAWVEVWSDGQRAYTGTLEPSQSLAVRASSGMRLVVGNAGGLRLTLNGKPVGPLGRSGEVCTVEITPQGAKIVPRTRPALDVGDTL